METLAIGAADAIYLIAAVMLGCGVLLFITPKTSLPWLVVVSMFSWMKRMFAPLTAISSTTLNRSVIERLNRDMRMQTTQSPGSNEAIMRSLSGRVLEIPDSFSWYNSPSGYDSFRVLI